MKKFIAITIIMAVMLTACGAQKATQMQQAEPGTVQENQIPEKENAANTKKTEASTKKSELLYGTYQVPAREIYVDTPALPYFSSEWGYSELYANGTERGIAITAIRNENASGKSAKDVYPLLIEEYLFSMRDYVTADEIVLDSEQVLTINGLEVYRFEGSIKGQFMSNFYDLYTVGYTFVAQDTPCSIQGSVFYKEQDPDSVKEIQEIVDAMIQTVRVEETDAE